MSSEDIKKFCHENSPIDLLEVEVIAEKDEVRLELLVEDKHTNPYGYLHGGVQTTIADTAMGAACLLLNKKVVTVSMTIEFLKAVKKGVRVYSDAKVLHNGRQILICECKLRGEDSEIYSIANATFFALDEGEK